MNFRDKIIKEDIGTCKHYWEHLTDWEQGFVKTAENAKKLTTRQFNRLQDVAKKLELKWG